jgi:sterol desaturase/sphingolipid hydroxylase (fatty acid hydroxylase superfamily)
MEKSDTAIKIIFAWLSYPLVLAAGVYAYLQLVEQGIALPIATYVPVISGAVIITVLEWLLPYRRQWHPTRDDVKADAFYMLLVQILLPRLLGFLIALTLLKELGAEQGWIHDLWVHDWPIGLQAVAMVLIADFLRYWVHRAAHKYSFLWRLHAVHHSTNKLYWMNTGRFHPLEKALQFVFDAMPFILLGVKPEVLALYFVFYALNGFFQHSITRNLLKNPVQTMETTPLSGIYYLAAGFYRNPDRWVS